jgi:hypothetical protein
VPSEVFRALDLDTTLHGGIDPAPESERAELSTQTSHELERMLASTEPALVPLLKGAREALLSENPDRTRHICISLRELLGHALRRLAPDARVAAWSSDPAHFHDGKPTRKARLEYLYGSLGASPLRRLIDADIRTTLELFDALSAGTHVANLGTGLAELVMLMTRAEGILVVLLHLAACRGDGT